MARKSSISQKEFDLERKFLIEFLLKESVSVNNLSSAREQMCIDLGISQSTLKNWHLIHKDSSTDIPFCQLLRIANYLMVRIEDIVHPDVYANLNKVGSIINVLPEASAAGLTQPEIEKQVA